MSKKTKVKLRRCFVLREVEINMLDLKKGDIFRLQGSFTDPVNQEGWDIADENAEKVSRKEGLIAVMCSPIDFIRGFRDRVRFR